jgi:CRP-like cAMP-binding protein
MIKAISNQTDKKKDVESSVLYQLMSHSISAPTEKFERLLSSSSTIQIPADYSVMKAHSPCKYFYLVKKGLLRAVFITDDGKEISKEFYWEGDIIFGMRALLDCQPLPYSVISAEACELIKLPLRTYQTLVATSLSWKDYHIRQVETHLLYKEIKEQLLLLNSNEQKVQKVYQLFPELVKRVPATLIASYLALTPVSLSRIKKRLSLNE